VARKLALVAVAVGAFASTAQSSTAPPAVKVASTAPLTIAGRNFVARERVRVIVVAKRQRATTVVADRRGRFVVRFALAVGDCTALHVAAKGNRGSRASYAQIPDCAPRSAQ
jgi:hypothetical protein